MPLIDVDELKRAKDAMLIMGRNATKVKRMVDHILDDLIENAPAVDAAPVVHGRWERRGGVFECSHCREYGGSRAGLYNFCPNCGAMMYGWEDE